MRGGSFGPSNEYEWLMDRGARFRITRITRDPVRGATVIDLEYLGQVKET